MATFKNRKGHGIGKKKQTLAITNALTALTLLNRTLLPGNPENYVSQYQLDIITAALGIEAVGDVSTQVDQENKYPILMEFPQAVEACRAGLYQLTELKEDF